MHGAKERRSDDRIAKAWLGRHPEHGRRGRSRLRARVAGGTTRGGAVDAGAWPRADGPGHAGRSEPAFPQRGSRAAARDPLDRRLLDPPDRRHGGPLVGRRGPGTDRARLTVAPVPTGWEPEQMSSAYRRYARLRWVGIGAAAVAGLGTLMPWVVATDESIPVTLSRSGIVGGLSGLTVLVFAILSILAFVVHTRFACWVATGTGIVAALLTATAINPSTTLLNYMGLPGEPHTGIGVWVSIAGAIGVVLVAL